MSRAMMKSVAKAVVEEMIVPRRIEARAGDRTVKVRRGGGIRRRPTEGAGPFAAPYPEEEESEEDEVEEQIVAETSNAEENSVTKMLLDSFRKIAGRGRTEIDSAELRVILNVAFQREFAFTGFSLETCRSLLSLVDQDYSGKMGFSEFRQLWSVVQKWKVIFQVYDRDRSGTLDTGEFDRALKDTGLSLTPSTIKYIVMRYSRRNNSISFDDFILCTTRLWKMQSIYDENRSRYGNKMRIHQDDFLLATMYT